MKHESLGIGIFILGILTLFAYTAFSFLWASAGISSPYPISLEGKSEAVGAIAFFSPPLGALLMIIGGFIYSMKNKEIK